MKIVSFVGLAILFLSFLFLGIDNVGNAQCDGSVEIASYAEAYGMTLKLFFFLILPVYALGFFTGMDD